MDPGLPPKIVLCILYGYGAITQISELVALIHHNGCEAMTAISSFPRMVRGFSCLLPLRFAGMICFEANLELLGSEDLQTPESILETPIPLPFRRVFSTTTCVSAVKKVNRANFNDPYAYLQAKQRKDANVNRQLVLRQQRAEANGDPIRGIPTPFVESFDTAIPASPSDVPPDAINNSVEGQAKSGFERIVESPDLLNNFVTKTELKNSVTHSYRLTKPIFSEPTYMEPTRTRDPADEAHQLVIHKGRHEDAETALNAILSLENASSKDRTRINIRRIIAKFGRHNTDRYLKPKAPSTMSMNPSLSQPKPMPRAGPDVGSSEVQIGILTAKIRVLADRYENGGRMDKANKRNLRLLLHRRQKLLKYMLRKERGSERWHHMTQTLGLTEVTWKGQLEVR